MGGSLNKVKSGDPLSIPAATFNAFIDTADDFQRRRHDQGQPASPMANRQAGVVLVKNTSGVARERYDVLGIDAPVFPPVGSEVPESFKNTVAIAGVNPTPAHRAGRLVILLEPLATDQIGAAMLLGVTPARVNMTEGTGKHRYAACGEAEGTPWRLTSAGSGPFELLWVEEGLGLKWALVYLSPKTYQHFAHLSAAHSFTIGDQITPIPMHPCNEDGQEIDNIRTVNLYPFSPFDVYRDDMTVTFPEGTYPYIPFGDDMGILVSPHFQGTLTHDPHPLLADRNAPGGEYYYAHNDVENYGCKPDALIAGGSGLPGLPPDGTARWNGIDPPNPPAQKVLGYDPAQPEGQRVKWTNPGAVVLADEAPPPIDPDGVGVVGESEEAAHEDHTHEHGPPGVEAANFTQNLVRSVVKFGVNGLTVTSVPLSIKSDGKGHLISASAGQDVVSQITLPQPSATVSTVDPAQGGTPGASDSYSRGDHRHAHGPKGPEAEPWGPVTLLTNLSFANGTLTADAVWLKWSLDAQGHVSITGDNDNPIQVTIADEKVKVSAGDTAADYLLAKFAPAILGQPVPEVHGAANCGEAWYTVHKEVRAEGEVVYFTIGTWHPPNAAKVLHDRMEWDGESWAIAHRPEIGSLYIGQGAGIAPEWIAPVANQIPWWNGASLQWVFTNLQAEDLIVYRNNAPTRLPKGTMYHLLQVKANNMVGYDLWRFV